MHHNGDDWAGSEKKHRTKNKKNPVAERESNVHHYVFTLHVLYISIFEYCISNNSIAVTVSMCLCVYWLTYFYTCVKVNV